MKYKVFAALCITFLLLFNASALSEERDLRATLGANATGWNVAIRVNGYPIPDITGGSAQAVQLFHNQYPDAGDFPANRKYLLCLQEGTNTLEATYSKVAGEAPFDLNIYVSAPGYPDPLIEVTKSAEAANGTVTDTFELHLRAPDGFKTKTLK